MNYSRKASTVFKIYDQKGDGYLSFNDVFRFLKDLCNTSEKNNDIFIHDVEDFMAIVDKDKDGRVTKDELMRYFESLFPD
jgi:Ca2+-binding EF-hand superfamily protein